MVTLHLKEDAFEYLEQARLIQLIKHFNEFITFPIQIWESHQEGMADPVSKFPLIVMSRYLRSHINVLTKRCFLNYLVFLIFFLELPQADKPVKEEPVKSVEDEDEDDKEPPEEEPTEPKTRTVWGWRTINSVQPLWTREKSSISREDYEKFYQELSGDKEVPLTYTHFRAEGDVEFTALLYVPSAPPANEGKKDEKQSKKEKKEEVRNGNE